MHDFLALQILEGVRHLTLCKYGGDTGNSLRKPLHSNPASTGIALWLQPSTKPPQPEVDSERLLMVLAKEEAARLRQTRGAKLPVRTARTPLELRRRNPAKHL